VFSRELLRAKILPKLRASLRQERRSGGARALAAGVYPLLDALREDGVDLGTMRGAWKAGDTAPRRVPRGSGPRRPCVELGGIRFLVDSDARALELAGLLNWCEVNERDLVQ
jgi:hypothetical protein